jgi:hypothetical protein
MPRTLSRRTVILGAGAVGVLVLRGTHPVAGQEATPTADPTVVALEREKLAGEAAKLKQEEARLRAQNQQPVPDWLLSNGILFAGIVGIIGGGFQLYRWRVDRREE